MSLYATQDEKKQAAAKAALKHLPKGGIWGRNWKYCKLPD